MIRSLVTPDGVVRDIVPMRWGFPAPPFYDYKANVTNVRNTASNYWKPYFKPGQRCLVPATAFSDPDRNTIKPVIFPWLARPGRELFYFAGIWRECEGDCGTRKVPSVGKLLLYSFSHHRAERCGRTDPQQGHAGADHDAGRSRAAT